jgi:hypothetical protein
MGAEAAMAVEEAVVVTHRRLLSQEPSCWCCLVRELFSPVTTNADFSAFSNQNEHHLHKRRCADFGPLRDLKVLISAYSAVMSFDSEY